MIPLEIYLNIWQVLHPQWLNLFLKNFCKILVSNRPRNLIHIYLKYKNEIQKYPHPYSAGSLELIAKYYGFLSGYKYAEAYEIVKLYEDHLNFIKKN